MHTPADSVEVFIQEMSLQASRSEVNSAPLTDRSATQMHYNEGADLLTYLVDPSVFDIKDGYVDALTGPSTSSSLQLSGARLSNRLWHAAQDQGLASRSTRPSCARWPRSTRTRSRGGMQFLLGPTAHCRSGERYHERGWAVPKGGDRGAMSDTA